MGPRAFAVDYELGPEAGPPLDGLDYLRRVKWEANRCPKVVKSEIDPRKFDAKQTHFAQLPPDVTACPPALAPSRTWETQFLASFESLRLSLHKRLGGLRPASPLDLPPINNAKAWKRICLGADAAFASRSGSTSTNNFASSSSSSSSSSFSSTSSPSSVADPSSSSSSSSVGMQPILSLVQQLDTVSTKRLLEHHITWALKAKLISNEQSLWLFVLLACLDKPLDCDMASSLRRLLRRFAKERATLTEPSDERLPSLNIIITIVAKYFGQGGD